LPSLAFEMPYCAGAEVAHANVQKIANANLMCPRIQASTIDRDARKCTPKRAVSEGRQAVFPLICGRGIREHNFDA
jgi:hypothetical protein